MIARVKNNIEPALESILNSYAQIFFTKNLSAALLIVLASFVNWRLGLWGLIAVMFTNGLAALMGYDRKMIREGLFGLNSLLVIFGLALSYQANAQFVLMVFAASVLTLFLSVGSLYMLSRLGLPMLSLPFLLSFWVILLASRQYTGLEHSEAGIFFLNEMYSVGGTEMIGWYEKINAIPMPSVLANYFRSLAAIIFQENLLAGFLLSVAILLSSRIAWVLSLFGFLMGHLFYQIMGADLTQLHFSYIGFNFVLTAIALGGFFFVPGWRTFMLVAVTAPLIAILIAATSTLLTPFGLPVYSLPFVLMVVLVVFTAYFNTDKPPFQKVFVQHYSPEKNLYSFSNYKQRFARTTFIQIALPFFGEWRVSQGHNSQPTHTGEWQHAWDFDITGKDGKTFNGDGYALQDYRCYNLPVVAPADGYVVEIVDEVPDNEIGSVNVHQNWGNTIILKHEEYLYSKLSHLKAGSFQVRKGDYVRKGEVIASLGNSGRSPEPHLHFQIQANRDVGSKTMKYPVSYFMENNAEGTVFHSYEIPQEGTVVYNVKTNSLLEKAYDWQPGKVLCWRVTDDKTGNIAQDVRWEVFTTADNQTYIYCHQSKSIAYFANDGTLFYFTGYDGSHDSLLYYFYLGAYKVILGYYKGLKITDQVPLHQVSSGPGKWLQDFVAPFFQYKKALYNMHFQDPADSLRPSEIKLKSTIALETFGRKSKEMQFTLSIQKQEIASFEVRFGNRHLVANQIESDYEQNN